MDISVLCKELMNQRVGKADVAIFRGTIPFKQLPTLIQQINFSEFLHVIEETSTELEFKAFDHDVIDQITKKVGSVHRLRFFGPLGDLEFKQRGDHFSWRFVGDKSPRKIEIKDYIDFWDENPDMKFFVDTQSVFLWGEYDAMRKGWFDSRVAKAKLMYPVKGTPGRVKIICKTYSESGQVSFVRLIDLEGSDGE